MRIIIMASEGSNLLFVSFRGRQVPVTFSRAVVSQQHAEMAIASEPFRTWLQRCEQQQHNSGSSSISISSAKTTTVGGYSAKQRLLDVHTIELQSVDMFGPRKVGFVKIKTHTTLLTDGDSATDDDDVQKPLPGICFLRGNAVSILVALFCEDGNVYSLLTDQPRVPLGMASLLELPAGMLDDETESVTGIAVKEMAEECGIVVTRSIDFVDLTNMAFCGTAVATGRLPIAALAPSAGGCDEMIRYLYLEKKVTVAELAAMQGRLQGLRDHGEYISLAVVPMDEVWKISGDSKAIISLFLVEQLRREGKLPAAGQLATPLNHHDHVVDEPDPVLRLSNGATIPQLAFGLYKVPADEKGEEIILQAIAAGYRHFDAATVYGNTAVLGRALRRSGLSRNQFFLASKVWNDAIRQGRDSVRASVEKELSELSFAGDNGAVWFDLLYLHWPVPGHFVDAYRELEAMHKEGYIRGIGLSNFNIEEYEELVRSGMTVPPIVNQFEVSPIMYRPDLVNYFQEKDIVVAASKSLSRSSAFENSPIRELAQKYAVSPAQIMLRWSLQKRLVPLCKTSTPDRMQENRSIRHFSLSDADVSLLDSLTEEETVRQRIELESVRKASE